MNYYYYYYYYVNDADFALECRKSAALVFVPEAEVVRVFEELVDSLPEALQPITDYLEDTYIGRLGRRQRRQPRFAITLWNMYERTVQELPRTNNAIEGYHQHLQSAVLCHQPNIWRFLEVLQRE